MAFAIFFLDGCDRSEPLKALEISEEKNSLREVRNRPSNPSHCPYPAGPPMKKIAARNQAMFKRLEENGYPLDTDGLAAPFNFTLSPVTSCGIADLQLIVDPSQRIRVLARKLDFRQVPLNCILIIPLILGPETPGGDNSSSLRKGIYKVKRHIDFLEWESATRAGRIKLLRAYLYQIIDDIPNSQVRTEVHDTLLNLIDASLGK